MNKNGKLVNLHQWSNKKILLGLSERSRWINFPEWMLNLDIIVDFMRRSNEGKTHVVGD